ncbi:MAG TPA: class I SAM-dependent methyltransferase [Verrucomicrobiae bacterium]|nr:class I SAM-dependent methyltransferase [Verrucomicrobiae bacterium]
MDDSGLKETVLVGLSSQGVEIRATPVRLTRYLVVFEIYREGNLLQVSEVLSDFRIIIHDRMLYSGRAIVKNLIDTGLIVLCEASLEDSWMDAELLASDPRPERVQKEFGEFFREWQKVYRILPEYKLLAADIHSFLTDFRLWVEQVELGIRALPMGDRNERERQTAASIAAAAFQGLDALFGQFERIAGTIDPELRPAHEVYVRRQIHPLVLCAPFAFRSVQKPLGYAGDYEMVNMICRDPHEGGSLFAKVLNRWFVTQAPAEAHRNRIHYLVEQLINETMRVRSAGGICRVFNAGCGPAGEVQRFMADSELASHARFVLLDFNEETITHARQVLEAARHKHGRTTQLDFTKKSVVQLLRGRSKAAVGASNNYDFVYCAGLFDYLPDSVCRQLIGVFYDLLAPGGLLVVTNVEPSNPIRHWLAYILDWHLIYRNAKQLLQLCPEPLAENSRIRSDPTGVNLFMEVRRPVS